MQLNFRDLNSNLSFLSHNQYFVFFITISLTMMDYVCVTNNPRSPDPYLCYDFTSIQDF